MSKDKTVREKEIEDAKKEAKVLKSLDHPYIMKYLDEHTCTSFMGDSIKEFRIAVEYCEGGNLRETIDSAKDNCNSLISIFY